MRTRRAADPPLVPGSDDGRERRRHERHRLEHLRVRLHARWDGREVRLDDVALGDVSASGVFVTGVPMRLPFRTPVRLELMADGHPALVVGGEAVHHFDAPTGSGLASGLGVELVAPPADLLDRLRAMASPPTPVTTERPPRVLIVDDDTALGEALARVLRGYDIPCRLVHSGRECHGLLSSIRDSLELVIVDALLPDTTGVALVQDLRALLPRARVLGISGVIRSRASNHPMITAGADAFLPKPFAGHEFRATVDRLLDRPQARR